MLDPDAVVQAVDQWLHLFSPHRLDVAISSAALDSKIDFIVWLPVMFFPACVLAAFVEFYGLSTCAQQSCP